MGKPPQHRQESLEELPRDQHVIDPTHAMAVSIAASTSCTLPLAISNDRR